MKKLSLVIMVLIFAVGSVLAQRTVTGTVKDDTGEALIGANILVKGTSVGAVTDLDGNYSVEVPEGSNTLVISYTGYETQELELGASNIMDVMMSEGVLLTEAVVTALGISRDEKSIGYAVQEVEGETLSNAREPNIVNSLQGRVAGVQIQGSPSALGGSSRITIRGANSFLGNNQPLFVIDGVPIDNQGFSTNSTERGFGAYNDGSRNRQPYDYGNTAQDIDPESIESMTVLKGAAAAALYGQRGANGVILITTKDGSGGKGFGIDVNSSVSFDNVANLIPHQQTYGGGNTNPNTTHGFNELIQDGETFLYPTYAKDGSWGPKYDPNMNVRHWDSWDPDASNYKETRPWVAPPNGYEEFFETGVTWMNTIAFSGANDKGSFRLGYTNTDQTGTFPAAALKRNTFNLSSRYQLHERITAGFVGNFVNTKANNRNITGYNGGNPMQAFTQWWQNQLDVKRLEANQTWTDGTTPYTWNARGPVVDQDGNLLSYDNTPMFFDNPYWTRNNFLQEDVRNRYYGNVNLNINLAKGLDLFGRAGLDNYQFSLREGVPQQSADVSNYNELERRFSESNLEARLTYNNTWDKISLNASVGVNRMRQINRSTELRSVGGLSLDGFWNISNSAGPPVVATNEINYGINSVYALASLGWDNWLYLDLTGRNDWSSTLPENNNSYFYPSVSVSAVLSELPGLNNLPVLNFIKLRANYAQVGNDAAAYRLYDVYAPRTPNFGSNPRYTVPIARNNPDLKPERTNEYEVGLDLRFFNGRLGIDFAYFDRSTTDQIFTVPASGATGFTSRILNAGEMRNWGYEIQLTGTIIQTKDFRWDAFVNAFRQRNEVVSLIEGVESIARGATWAADLRVAEGVPYMALYGQDYVYHENGQPMVDEFGNYMFTDERVFLGSAVADWTGGFGTSVEWKGLFASVLFDWQQGGIIHSTSLQWSKYSGMHPETVSFNGVEDVRADGLILPGVKEDGSTNDIAVDPQTYYQTFWNRAAPNVFKANFLKFREFRIGYSFPNKLMGNSGFRDVTLSVFGRNLAILSADLPYLDPQIVTGAGNDQGLENAQIPSTRSIGVNLQFKL